MFLNLFDTWNLSIFYKNFTMYLPNELTILITPYSQPLGRKKAKRKNGTEVWWSPFPAVSKECSRKQLY